MAIANSYVSLPEGTYLWLKYFQIKVWLTSPLGRCVSSLAGVAVARG